MIKRGIMLCIILAVLQIPVTAKETLLMAEKDFKGLMPEMTVSICRILDDGTLLCLGEPRKGKSPVIFLLDPHLRKITKKVAVTAPSVDYTASDGKGDAILVFSYESHAFYRVNLAEGSCTVLFRREKGRPGFDLFSHGRSFLTFTGDKALAWGYFYDGSFTLEGEYLTQIDPSRPGAEAFSKILKNDELKQIASQYAKGVEKIGAIRANGEFIVFPALQKSSSTLIAYSLKDKVNWQIASSPAIMGVAVARNAPLAAFIEKRSGGKEAELILYNIEGKKDTVLGRGKLLNPVFSSDAKYLAAGIVKIGDDRKLGMDISLHSLAVPGKAPLLLPCEKGHYFIDWKFVKGDSELILLTGKEVYGYKLK